MDCRAASTLPQTESELQITEQIAQQGSNKVVVDGAASSLEPAWTAFGHNPQIVYPKVSIIIPTKNEAKNLPHVLPYLPTWVHEVILVDGHSNDGTVEVAKALCAKIQVVQQKGRGKGAALRTGFALATGDILVMLDADGSMNPGEIPLYLGPLLIGADFAKGSRFLQGGGTHDMDTMRYLGNLALTWILRCLHGGSYSDLCYGYNAFWRRILSEINLDADGFEIETQINVRILQAGLRIHEVASIEARRIYGESNLDTFRDGWRVLKTIVREWFSPQVTCSERSAASLSHHATPLHLPVATHRSQSSVKVVGEG